MRTLGLILGVVLVLMGGLWALQGLGIVMWPAESFMLAQRQWAIYGAVVAAIGLALIAACRRRRG